MSKDEFVKVGKTTFRKSALAGMKKTEFKETYKGLLTIDLDEAWKQVFKYTKKSK